MILANFSFKKIGLILVFLIIAGAIGWFIFSLFFKTNVQIEPGVGTEQTGTGTGLPEAGTGTGTTTTNENGQLPGTQNQGNQGQNQGNEATNQDNSTDLGVQASGSRVGSNGQIEYYDKNDGRFYKLGADGKAVALSDKQFPDVQNITWAPNSDKAILEFPDGSKIRYNFTSKEQVTLPKHWEGFDFSPTGDKIVAKSIGIDPDNRWLVTANDDGSKAQKIEELGENGDKVISSWSPNNQSIALFVDGVDFNRKEVFFVGLNGENFKSMVVEGRGFESKWSPKGDELLYSVYSSDNDYKPTLWLAGAQGDSIGANRRPLGIDTWANKCSFTSGSIYCAVPQTLERGAGLFPTTANSTPDTLYRINPQTGIKEQISLGSGSYTMSNLSLSADGMYLYFTDTTTGRLRQIKVR
ncbi:MAG: hypothetical protein NTY12_00495 [Candidatus Falkowbacteria bacterium]|nr:hypothetical protein [Candidatus Falkowbacteria bacterium]